VLGPQAQVSGPAAIINEEARSLWNELQVHLAPDAGSAPASCYAATPIPRPRFESWMEVWLKVIMLMLVDPVEHFT
jgi:hypothetical protein